MLNISLLNVSKFVILTMLTPLYKWLALALQKHV